ncbi:IclR family transcriptional regulator [Dactylosporangium sp. NPDC051484]|uniref:IclR family transcriptional regulator n=1 Tax=Dactylosporangium sp. NPDC051484 TaxID=3154942 RepID=UPI00344B02F5
MSFDGVSKEYSLGPVLTAVGSLKYSADSIVASARNHLARWASETQFTAFLAQWLPDRTIVILDKVDSPLDIKMTVQIGQRFPWSAAALGKAFMAFMDESERQEVLRINPLPSHTAKSISSQETWLAELDIVRERGWSSSQGEYYSSTNSVVAPIFGPQGSVLAAVGSLATTSDLKESDIGHYGLLMRTLADDIEASIFPAGRTSGLVH